MEKNYKAKPLNLNNNSAVDLIVPFHGQYERTCRLIESIHKTVRIKYELILVDDHSPNEHFHKTLQASKVRVIRNSQQLGFGGSLQVGWKASSNPIIIFLHSDCVMNYGCIDLLIKDLVELKGENVAMVSARTDNAGEADPRLVAKRGETGDAVILDLGYIPFFCVASWRNVFDKVGFIRPYFPAGYEDEEFAYRLQYYKYKQAISGRAWVHHEGAATIQDLCKIDSGVKDLMENNRNFCLEDLRKLFSKG